MQSQEELYAEAMKEKESILEELKPLRAIEQNFLYQIHALELQLEDVRLRIKAVEIPRLVNAKKIISATVPRSKYKMKAEG
jgi:hypothetical protein